MKRERNIKIDGRSFITLDIDEQINAIFDDLYQLYLGKGTLNWTDIIPRLKNYITTIYEDALSCEQIFNCFYYLWSSLLGINYFEAQNIWPNVIKLVEEWEEDNKQRIHQGTLYYLWGMTSINFEDLEQGFLLMHQALKEDEETFKANYKKYPAYSFVSLDYENPEQLFYPKVKELTEILKTKIELYNKTRGGNITISIFKKRFLENSELQDIVFLFVFELFHLNKFNRPYFKSIPDFTTNDLSRIVQVNLLFSFCLIVENLIKKKKPKRKGEKPTFRLLLDFIYKFDPLIKEKNNLIAFKEMNNNFLVTLKKVLSASFTYQGKMLRPIDEDLMVVYGFRNFGGHSVESHTVVSEKFEEISQYFFNALFLIIEILYK